jgi:predicted SPOUT superfamily RNA methylase MTH1
VVKLSESRNFINKKQLTIAVPASVISDTPHLREKTSKIGLIGRAAAIFRVDKIIVYPDNRKANQTRDMDFIALLLNYLETPQYLRRRLFKLENRLQYAGILPPLRTPHHLVADNIIELKIGEYREGMVISEAKEGFLVDVGVGKLALLRQNQYAVGDRLTLQVIKTDEQVEVQTVNRDDMPLYWGFRVRLEKRSFAKLVMDREFDLTIATARFGDKFVDIAGELGKKWEAAEKILLGFGAPTRGLHEITKEEGVDLEAIVEFVANMLPGQGTMTVRTEEAILASLAILNMYFKW